MHTRNVRTQQLVFYRRGVSVWCVDSSSSSIQRGLLQSRVVVNVVVNVAGDKAQPPSSSNFLNDLFMLKTPPIFVFTRLSRVSNFSSLPNNSFLIKLEYEIVGYSSNLRLSRSL